MSKSRIKVIIVAISAAVIAIIATIVIGLTHNWGRSVEAQEPVPTATITVESEAPPTESAETEVFETETPVETTEAPEETAEQEETAAEETPAQETVVVEESATTATESTTEETTETPTQTVAETNSLIAESADWTGKVTASALNFRDYPSVSGNKITTLVNGTEVHIIGVATTGWYAVDYSGQTLYCSNKYIVQASGTGSTEKTAATESPAVSAVTEAPAVTVTDPSSLIVESADWTGYVTTSSLNLRDYPSTDGNKVGAVSYNSEVHVIGVASTGWYAVSYNGQTVFCSNKYISTEKQSTSGFVQAGSGASAEVVAYANQVWNSIPEAVRNYIMGGGYQIKVVSSLSSRFGFSYSITGLTYQNTIWIDNRTYAVDRALLHECGHAVDLISGGVSYTSEFYSIYSSELSSWYDSEDIGDHHGSSDPQEYFASTFVSIMRYGDTYYSYSPKTYDFVKSYIPN